jgi:hypothetical protein
MINHSRHIQHYQRARVVLYPVHAISPSARVTAAGKCSVNPLLTWQHMHNSIAVRQSDCSARSMSSRPLQLCLQVVSCGLAPKATHRGLGVDVMLMSVAYE